MYPFNNFLFSCKGLNPKKSFTGIPCKGLDQRRSFRETIGTDQGTLLVFGDAEILYAEAEGFNSRWISK